MFSDLLIKPKLDMEQFLKMVVEYFDSAWVMEVACFMREDIYAAEKEKYLSCFERLLQLKKQENIWGNSFLNNKCIIFKNSNFMGSKFIITRPLLEGRTQACTPLHSHFQHSLQVYQHSSHPRRLPAGRLLHLYPPL